MSHAPIRIRAHQNERLLELTWEGGSQSNLPYHYARGQCPCASCVNEVTGVRILDPSTLPADLRLEGMEPIGAYAVRFSWSDGHSTGLYTWETLRRLADEAYESYLQDE